MGFDEVNLEAAVILFLILHLSMIIYPRRIHFTRSLRLQICIRITLRFFPNLWGVQILIRRLRIFTIYIE